MNTLQAAIKYLKSGVAPIPIWPDERKNPHLSSTKEYSYKLPSVSDWERWVKQWPDTNIALITGYWGLCALDFDTTEAFDEWVEGHWNDVCPTWVVQTARGFHVWFNVIGEIGPSTNYTRNGHEVLARCRGGYCIVPPSMHVSGSHYTTVVSSPPAEIESITDVLKGWQNKLPKQPQTPPEMIIPKIGAGIRIEDLVPIPEGARPNKRGAYKVRCPFTQNHKNGDTNFSAWVNIEQQRFGCNSCWPDMYWDVVNVYAMLNNISNSEAYQVVKGATA